MFATATYVFSMTDAAQLRSATDHVYPISSKQLLFFDRVYPRRNWPAIVIAISIGGISPGGHSYGCYPGALYPMSGRCDLPGDRVHVDEIYGHSVFGWVELILQLLFV